MLRHWQVGNSASSDQLQPLACSSSRRMRAAAVRSATSVFGHEPRVRRRWHRTPPAVIHSTVFSREQERIHVRHEVCGRDHSRERGRSATPGSCGHPNAATDPLRSPRSTDRRAANERWFGIETAPSAHRSARSFRRLRDAAGVDLTDFATKADLARVGRRPNRADMYRASLCVSRAGPSSPSGSVLAFPPCLTLTRPGHRAAVPSSGELQP